MLKPFFRYLLEDKPGRDELLEEVIERLRKTVGNKKPYVGTIDFDRQKATAVIRCLGEGKKVELGELLRDPGNRSKRLDMLVFVAQSGGNTVILPDDHHQINEGDQLLICGTTLARRLFNSTLNNEYKLFYVQTGKFKPESYLMQWYVNKKNKSVV